VKLNWYKQAILEEAYGGFPSGGYFKSFKEYELGAQRIGEAAHCIIGSCSRIHQGGYEQGGIMHMEEEIGIIRGALEEYQHPIYILQYIEDHQDNISDFYLRSIKSLEENGNKLYALTKSKQAEFNSNDNDFIYNIVINTMKLLEVLSKNMIRSSIEIRSLLNDYDSFKTDKTEDNEKLLLDFYTENEDKIKSSNKLSDVELNTISSLINFYINNYWQKVADQ
jgi:hypothetical protein